MPTILTHALVPLALGAGIGCRRIPPRLIAAGMVAAVLPDLDVIAFQAGVPLGSELSHRGFTHSLCFAAGVAFIGMSIHARLHAGASTALWFLFAACASHGVLDAFTNGGSGIALLWPFSAQRYFAPVTPIEVSPIGLERFLTARGVAVLWSEMLWVWLPCIGAMLAFIAVRRLRRA